MKTVYKTAILIIYSVLIALCLYFWVGQFKVELTFSKLNSYIIMPNVAYPLVILFSAFNIYITYKLPKNETIKNTIMQVEDEIKLTKLQKELEELKSK